LTENDRWLKKTTQREKKTENSYEKMRQSPCFFSVWVGDDEAVVRGGRLQHPFSLAVRLPW